MKQLKLFAALMLGFLLISLIAADTTIPRIEPYVNDFAGLLSPAEELQLNQLADQIETNTTFEIAIVTVQSTGGQDRLQYANMIGDQNGVGKKDADNGIVVLWSVSEEEGGAIATGRGSESFVTDAVTGTIGRAARHYFDSGEYYNGMNYIVTELNKAIVKHQTPINNSEGLIAEEGTDLPPVFWFLLFIGSMFILIPLMKGLTESSSDDYNEYDSSDEYSNPKRRKKNRKMAATAAALAVLATSDDDDDSSDDSSGGFSGGFGGFGGGGFGGGGSRW